MSFAFSLRDGVGGGVGGSECDHGEMGAKFRLRVIGRFPAHLRGNEASVSATLLSGPDEDHLSVSGTLTMAESEWRAFLAGLRRGFASGLEVDGWSETEAR